MSIHTKLSLCLMQQQTDTVTYLEVGNLKGHFYECALMQKEHGLLAS